MFFLGVFFCFSRVSAKKNLGFFFAVSQAKPGIPALCCKEFYNKTRPRRTFGKRASARQHDDDELNINPPTSCKIGKRPPAPKPKREPAGHQGVASGGYKRPPAPRKPKGKPGRRFAGANGGGVCVTVEGQGMPTQAPSTVRPLAQGPPGPGWLAISLGFWSGRALATGTA